ncbi:hypothetical protein WA026_006732 [Henosepilachna vigintioctopunctata]|uniref:Uncharacterized protein n=1 Tax=Henosepilachna vigintioctopunctata TaxID=420089 RepID=A0AAW1U7S5_9CUCU
MTLDTTQHKEQAHNSKSCKRPSTLTTPVTPNSPQQILHEWILKEHTNISTQSVEDQIDPFQQYLQDSITEFVLNFNQISSFLRNDFESSDPVYIAQEYTNDMPELLNMLSIYPHCTQRSRKSRITRIQKKIRLNTTVKYSTTTTNLNFREGH